MFLRNHAKALCAAIAALALLCAAPTARAADTTITLNTVGSAPVDMLAPLSFMDSVKIALARSATLKTTVIDLQTSKLNEKDTWYRLFPKLGLNATYSVPILKDPKSKTRYKEVVNMGFNTGTYDPITAYISHDASKIAVKLAEMLHVVAIEDVMGKIALAYIDIDSINAEIAHRQAIIGELESLQRYTAKRLEAGTINELDLKLVEQRVLLARQELKRTQRAQDQARRSLKRLIGLTSNDNVVFDTDNATDTLGTNDVPEEACRAEQLLDNNLQLKAQELSVQLEGYNITLSRAGHIPRFAFGLTTPDPLSNQAGHLPYYIVWQTSVPIWSWGETLRSTERAQLKQQSSKAARMLQLQNIQQTIDDVQATIQANEETAATSEALAQLRKLESVRKEINFHANTVGYEVLINTREGAILSKIEAIKAKRAVYESRIKLKIATGRLLSEYIRVNYGELEKN